MTWLIIATALLVAFAFMLRKYLSKAKNLSNYQTYSKSVKASLIESGVFTEHGIVYDPSTRKVTAQHKKSDLFYETVL
jgi:predicted small secreted protein